RLRADQAGRLRRVLRPVHRVEEMPVQETLDAAEELAALGLPVGKVIVNGAQPPLPSAQRVGQADLRRGLAAAELPTDRLTVAGLHAEAKAYAARLRLQESLRGELAELGLPVVELPLLPEGIDRDALQRLADILLAG